MNKQELGLLVKQRRIEKGLSKKELAVKLGVATPRVYEMEDANHKFGIDTILKYLDALDLEIQVLPKKNVGITNVKVKYRFSGVSPARVEDEEVLQTVNK